MGEYVKFRGQSVKIGTCEDLYYTTLPGYIEALNKGSISQDGDYNVNPQEVIKPNIFRFRFPFPDEDYRFNLENHDIYHKNFTKGVNFIMNKKLADLEGVEIGHEKDCSSSENYRSEILEFNVAQQKIVKDSSSNNEIEVQTVVRCPHCGAGSRFSKEEILKLSIASLKNPLMLNDYQKEILAIAKAGYFKEVGDYAMRLVPLNLLLAS